MSRIAALLLIAAATAPCVAGTPAAPEPAFVATMSRGVKVFSELESKLGAAARARSDDALGELLDENFEVRESSTPGRPVSRAEWRDQIATRQPADIELSQMAVHDLGAEAVVSFLGRDKDTAGAVWFVVDLWRKQGASWVLVVRYRSPGERGEEQIAPTGKN